MNRLGLVLFILNAFAFETKAEDQGFAPLDLASRDSPADVATDRADVTSGAILQLGLDFGSCSAKSTSGCGSNSIVSPLSLTNALTMVMAGCNGTSYSQLHRALNYPKEAKERAIHNELGFINGLLTKLTQVEVNVANGLFSIDPLAAQFMTKDKKSFVGETFRALNPETMTPRAMVGFINKWVAKRTENRITDIVSSLDADTKLVVANAVYFKADWMNVFPSDITLSDNFTISSDEMYPVATMFNVIDVDYVEDSEFKCKMIALPYKGGQTAMYLILPTERQGLSSLTELELKLNASVINRLIGQMTTKMTSVSLPKFKLEQTLSVKDLLMSKGVTDIFSAATSDLSRMFKDDQSVAIDDIVHKAFIQVSETGTEAAAATVVFITRENSRRMFHANRPFLFFIRDQRSGAVLFSGRLVRPDPVPTK